MPYDAATVLQRVLLLERAQGFQDRAAVGGLSAFALGQASREPSDAGVALQAVVERLAGYEAASRQGREAAVAEALSLLLAGPRGTAAAKPVAASAGDAAPARAARESVRRARPAAQPGRPDDLDRGVTVIKGVGESNAKLLAVVGVRTVRDLLYYFPRTHLDYSDTRAISRMRVGEQITLIGTIKQVRVNRVARKGGPGAKARSAEIVTAVVADDTGTVAVRWFNNRYLADRLPEGARIAVTGEPDLHNGFVVFQPRDYELIQGEDLVHAARLVPVYPLTKGLYQRSVRALLRRAVEAYAPVMPDFLPEPIRAESGLLSLGNAIRQYHFPEDEAGKQQAQRRLAFDELLLIQLGFLRRKQAWQTPVEGVALQPGEGALEPFFASLPFALTRAQRRVIGEIIEDLGRPVPMSRLLEGDVGSGKTVVAAAALVHAVRAGRQGLLMAPTEILAEQHHRTLAALLEPLGIRCDLLVGSTPKSRRKVIHEAASAGHVDVLVGTHALIQEDVELARVGLAITDEQHRFGVEQRAALRRKGLRPHVMAMTATPIPRTLALTIYGDLDISVIDEMPPGRLPPVTTWSRKPVEAYGVIRDEVTAGRQAFVICPVIEESAETDMRSVVAEHKELQERVFPELKVGLLHGRMKASEKDRMLADFRAGAYQILVATSVVEVGIDIPNATVMVIRDAHRFGLAQLHQFRGRVGRGGDQAFCVLLSDAQGEEARERLEALTATENGFELAEADLRLRGPGEFWGTRQSGLPELRVATLGDVRTIEMARRAAQGVLRADSRLEAEQHLALRERVERFWNETSDLS